MSARHFALCIVLYYFGLSCRSPLVTCRVSYDVTYDFPLTSTLLLRSAPQGYTNNGEPWPLVLFLHGAGESGDNASKLVSIGGQACLSQLHACWHTSGRRCTYVLPLRVCHNFIPVGIPPEDAAHMYCPWVCYGSLWVPLLFVVNIARHIRYESERLLAW
eukprot:1626433-Pyramimonas_sp.AAC.1